MKSRRRARATRRIESRRSPSLSPPLPVSPPRTPVLAAEPLLLELARTLAKRTVTQPADLAAVVDALAAAYAPDGALAVAFRTEWLGVANNKTARLALAWAREQVRLALLEILERARAEGLVKTAGDTETLAWLCLAGCEALAHEPPSAIPDRVQALARFLAESR